MADYRNKLFILKEIHQKLTKHYDASQNSLSRSLTITSILNDYGRPGTVFFSIIGSPPKAYS